MKIIKYRLAFSAAIIAQEKCDLCFPFYTTIFQTRRRKDTEKKGNSVSLRFYFSITTSNKCYNIIVAKL